MLNRFLLLACGLIVALGISVVPFPDGAVALMSVLILSAGAVLLFRRYTDEKEFITMVFLVGLALRLGFGIMVQVFDMRDFFGGDAVSYDRSGAALVNVWLGHAEKSLAMIYLNEDPASGAGWGMNYFTGFIYLLLGRNIFAAQSFCAVIGAATAPMVFFCSHKIFGNLRVAKISALFIALFPSFIRWSSQLLKDGLIIFLLVAAITMVLQLQKKFNYAALALLVFSLIGILSLRFYIFYMVVVAVVGSFIVGLSTTNKSIFARTAILVVLSFAFLYLGVAPRATLELNTFGNLRRIQSSRSDLMKAAGSGFGADVDVSTTGGAISAIPIGFTYLMFAPFPWQATNLRQAITIPEVLFWWAMVPFLVIGLWYAIRHRLRNAFPILIFSLLLTLAYSIFQGNVGTAYRQRTQIQVFLFIFIAVGWQVYQERRENHRMLRADAQRRVAQSIRGNAVAPNRS
jgi:hypothetical protein